MNDEKSVDVVCGSPTGPATYPFSALVGQEDMKEALLLNAVDPRIGGVLIRGGRGTAKTTAARALADLFPWRRGKQDS